MELLIAKVPQEVENNYRGTNRDVPSYHEELEAISEVNQAFFWYCESVGQGTTLQDLDGAVRLVTAYRNLAVPEYFEIIEVTKNSNTPHNKGRFLGYDLAAKASMSLINQALNIDISVTKKHTWDTLLKNIDPLVELLKLYFRPKLNQHSLFDEHNAASFCLQCMMSLQFFRPNLWEAATVVYEVVGLWAVDIDR
jgi:hypothetical protein